MLHEFVNANREAILQYARARVAARRSPKPNEVELTNGIPLFLDELVHALRHELAGGAVDHGQIDRTAGRHGQDLFRMGLTIAQVVHDYGDVCQAIVNRALETEAAITSEEFRALNLCLDDAIAGAVSEYSRQREAAISAHGTERLGVLAHELRNQINNATLAFHMIKTGQVPAGGGTAHVLERSLLGLRNLVDRSLAEVRLDAGLEHVERFLVAELIEEVEIGAFIQARSRGLALAVDSIDPGVTLEGDRQILAGALANLLQNAFKFTRHTGSVSLSTRVTAETVAFDVEDECGGLPPGKAEELFRPYEQRGADRSGVGLGLSICLRAAQAGGGHLRVRDLPGKGCVFTLELPRKRRGADGAMQPRAADAPPSR